ncbi:hypothetical protein I7I51_01836 [Histoplasma capsulatum]|uniref:Uncharacterized protein n=1 Tax=Ajellomyces capsulatus TaxID=5037 RepID=A0A8A1MJI6_AJECA|nr:hypothetical protein I7I51_01836 [Histoplasma capsulatum]
MSPPTVRQLDDNNGTMLGCVGCVAMKVDVTTKVSSTSTLTNAPDDVIRESCNRPIRAAENGCARMTKEDSIKRRDSARKPRQRKWFSTGSKAATRVNEMAARSQGRKVASRDWKIKKEAKGKQGRRDNQINISLDVC